MSDSGMALCSWVKEGVHLFLEDACTDLAKENGSNIDNKEDYFVTLRELFSFH